MNLQSSSLGPGFPDLPDYEDDGLDDPAENWDAEDEFWASADRAYEVNR